MPEFYHVDRVTGQLTPEQLIKFIHSKSEIKDKTDRAEAYTSLFPEGVTYHGFEYLLNDKRKPPNEDALGAIEVLAEFIRRSEYPERPSRFQSFFACKSLKDAERFISLFPVTTPTGQQRNQGDIWLVRCDSVLFEGDMNYLGLGTCWLDAITRKKHYWDGARQQMPLLELLLMPPVTIVKKVKTIR